MTAIGIRALQRNPSQVIQEVEESGTPMFVTRHGRPAVVILPLDEEAFEDYVLANAPEYVASRQGADRNLRAGKTKPMGEVFAQLHNAD